MIAIEGGEEQAVAQSPGAPAGEQAGDGADPIVEEQDITMQDVFD